jgi:hypothetical protein
MASSFGWRPFFWTHLSCARAVSVASRHALALDSHQRWFPTKSFIFNRMLEFEWSPYWDWRHSPAIVPAYFFFGTREPLVRQVGDGILDLSEGVGVPAGS